MLKVVGESTRARMKAMTPLLTRNSPQLLEYGLWVSRIYGFYNRFLFIQPVYYHLFGDTIWAILILARGRDQTWERSGTRAHWRGHRAEDGRCKVAVRTPQMLAQQQTTKPYNPADQHAAAQSNLVFRVVFRRFCSELCRNPRPSVQPRTRSCDM